MQSIHDIRFDNDLYAPTTHWALLLYEQNGVSLAVPLPNANLMSFIKPFDNIKQCQHHVDTNLQKLITLFAWDDNIQQWLANANDVPANLQEIKIFCNSVDRTYVNACMRRYMHRLRNVTIEIINCDKLNYGLMLFGVDHLKKLDADFPPNSVLQRRLHNNYKQICRALATYFWYEANAE
ncbi:unnamed protein product [Adineta steineri]|uniref:Uncharacterized protein n=1 Tax=Adineta steineri TaxID=433720 RepID=A0A816AV76_9BILA|nr:unnamed protein product [Adineta steineri]CAF1601265.1 unnamed protein product [Adineta steineri]